MSELRANNRAWIIFKKELIDNLRDRRSLRNVLISLLLTPIMISLGLYGLSRMTGQGVTRPLEVPVEGAEYAPGLIDYLKNNNVKVLPPVADPEAAIRNFDHEVVMIIPANYGEEFQKATPATIKLVYDDSQRTARGELSRLRELLRSYSMTVGSLRLMVRGVDPAILQAVAIEGTNLATPLARAFMVISLIPMLLLLAIQSAGLYCAIDAMTGERERGSLEALLITPIRPHDLVLGKLGMTLAFAATALALSVLGSALALNLTPVELPGMRIELSLANGLLTFALLIPLAFLMCTAQILLASHSASFKEAQSGMSYLMLGTMLPSIMDVYLPFKPPVWSMLVPIYSQSHLLGSLLKGDVLQVLPIALSTIGTLVLFGLLLFITIRSYDRERVLFAARN